MRALILDMISHDRQPDLLGIFGKIDTKVLNKPLMVHHIENLKDQGISQIHLITNQELPTSLQDGKRWGVELDISTTLDPAWVQTCDSENWLIIPGNYLVDFDVRSDQWKALTGEGAQSWSVIAEEPEFFYPIMVDLKRALTEAQQQSEMSPQMLYNFIGRRDTHQVTRFCTNTRQEVNDYKSFWETHQKLFKTEGALKNPAGLPYSDQVWVDVGSRVHESSSAQGLALIGRNTRIHKNVELRGFVVIGDNVVVDEGTSIVDSVILDNTYVGKQTILEQAVVDKKILYRADLDTAMLIEDAFLLGATGYQ